MYVCALYASAFVEFNLAQPLNQLAKGSPSMCSASKHARSRPQMHMCTTPVYARAHTHTYTHTHTPLPHQVQRQVWEFDKNLLQADALPTVGQYKYEVATIMRAMAMDEFLSPVVTAVTAKLKDMASAGGAGGGAAPTPDPLAGEEEEEGSGGPLSARGSGPLSGSARPAGEISWRPYQIRSS